VLDLCGRESVAKRGVFLRRTRNRLLGLRMTSLSGWTEPWRSPSEFQSREYSIGSARYRVRRGRHVLEGAGSRQQQQEQQEQEQCVWGGSEKGKN